MKFSIKTELWICSPWPSWTDKCAFLLVTQCSLANSGEYNFVCTHQSPSTTIHQKLRFLGEKHDVPNTCNKMCFSIYYNLVSPILNLPLQKEIRIFMGILFMIYLVFISRYIFHPCRVLPYSLNTATMIDQTLRQWCANRIIFNKRIDVYRLHTNICCPLLDILN